MQSKKPSTSGIGLGVPVDSAIATTSAFEIGQYRLHGPLTFSCCGSSEATSRLIGTESSVNFDRTFDYAAGKLHLGPNKALVEPFNNTPL